MIVFVAVTVTGINFVQKNPLSNKKLMRHGTSVSKPCFSYGDIVNFLNSVKQKFPP